MSSRRQRIRNRAYQEIWVDEIGSSADRDTKCDTWANDNNIGENTLGNWCPRLKKDIMA